MTFDKKAWTKRYYAEHREEELLRCKLKQKKEWRIKAQRKYMLKNPDKIKAHNKSRKMPKKEKCEICEEKAVIERHHWRYDMPLLFASLCRPCHMAQHHSKINLTGGD